MTLVRRPRAVELRFVVSAARAAEILSWARAELDPDPHGAGPSGDAYHVTTVYFDTPQFDVAHRRGSFGKAKYRIRRYGTDDTVFLERKLRTSDMLVKRRTRIPLVGMSDAPEAAWFARRIAARHLQRTCAIAYDRVARQVAQSTTVARLTVDSNLHAARYDEVDPFRAPEHPLVPGQWILELKYQNAPPAAFKALAERFLLAPGRMSKYRAAVSALSLTDLQP
jgi:hypothetical protein